MIFKAKLSFLLLTGLLFLGCSSTKDLPTRTDFAFTFDDEPFEIISISAPSGEGYNYLIKKEEGKSVFRSMDTNQDGIIDLVQYGPFSIDQANSIYTYGIQQAIDQHKFKARNTQRILTITENDTVYTIQTFGYYRDLLYNQFTINSLVTDSSEIYLDMNADGELDNIEKSERSLEEVQKTYQRIIQNGVENKLIEFRFEKFIVLISPKEQASWL
ncbi:hypothetical protein [Gracilimonas sp.]|uniref:hypothetical protein n=1 Tax=Gracilimonas sp. TaxID=1974203 RepID=UPI0032EB136A